MSTYYPSIGTIKITPMITGIFEKRLQIFLKMRHMKRNTHALMELYPTPESRKRVTLLNDGDFGSDGVFYIPKKTREASWRYSVDRQIEGLNIPGGMATHPSVCPDLYTHLQISHSEKDNCTYLGWDKSDGAWSIPKWLKFLAPLLAQKGYHLEGRMFFEDGEFKYSFADVTDKEVTITDWVPNVTYQEDYCRSLSEEEEGD